MRSNQIILTFLLALFLPFISNSQSNYSGFDVIGRGYDIFGEYANTKSIMNYPLFDFSRMRQNSNQYNQTVPKLILVKNVSDHNMKTFEGNSTSEYVASLSQEMGLSGGAFFFKGSVDGQFKSSESQTENTFYYTYMDVNTKWKVILDVRNLDTLRNYLDVQFKSDLAKLEPKELFELYGTHFIANAYLGGRIDYSTVSNLKSSLSKSDAKMAINAKYKVIEGDLSIDERSKRILQQLTTVENLNVIGGNSEYTNSLQNHEQYLKWAEGIKNSPVLSDFDAKSLKPIWLLASTEHRRKQLESYYKTKLLPNHPIPKNYTKDAVLDNTEFTQNFGLIIDGFVIHQDCDNYLLTGDEAGDFKYDIAVYVNDELVNRTKTKSGYVNRVWSGETLELMEIVEMKIPMKEGAEIMVRAILNEEDDLKTEELGGLKVMRHKFPFSSNDLYNYENEGKQFWKESMYSASDCNATFYYRILPNPNKTAVDFGNEGWKAYETGDYSQCLYYSKEALKIDNALWYVHYNVGLVYLIQGNPHAFEKYKLISNMCRDKKKIKYALDDINNHEAKHGKLENSEPIKLLLRSKL